MVDQTAGKGQRGHKKVAPRAVMDVRFHLFYDIQLSVALNRLMHINDIAEAKYP
jgi:hypothetical protein